MIKRSVSVLLAFLMLIGTFVIAPSAAAEDNAVSDPDTAISNGDITVSGNNSLGNMLAAEYEEHADEIEDTGSGVYAVEITGTSARVDVRTLVDAKLIISIFDETGTEMCASGMTEVTPDDSVVELEIETESMPQYFIIRAFLLDKTTNLPLCKQFESDYYTQEMLEFFAKTTEDFDEDKVLNLDDSEEDNFLVYSDDTIMIENDDNTNIVTAADDENKEYVIENIDDSISSLKEGDIFS